MDKRGWFFAFEGIDCSGKSTQLKLVAEKLRFFGYEVRETREPGGTEMGENIRKLLLDPAYKNLADPMTNLLLHNAARRQSVKEIIAPSRGAGKIILSDRSFISTLAYQCFLEGVDLDFAKQLCFAVMENNMPDKIFLLNIGLAEEAIIIMNEWVDLSIRHKLPHSLVCAVAPYGAMARYKKAASYNAAIHEYGKRLCWTAQEEVYHITLKLRCLVLSRQGNESPLLNMFPPACVRTGRCGEGKRYCGRNIKNDVFVFRKI